MSTTAADMIRPAIPGLSLRPYRRGDGAALAGLENADNAADGIHWRSTGEEVENWYARPRARFDASRDVLVVELDGRVVAETNISSVDTTDGLREYRIGCTVHPDLRRRGIGRWLMRLSEEAAAARLHDDPTERAAVLGTWCPDQRIGLRALIEQEGYRAVRYFFDMERPSLDGLVLPPMPAGLEVRPVPPGQLRQLWDADVEAFLDHWGGFDASDERFETWLSDPKFDAEPPRRRLGRGRDRRRRGQRGQRRGERGDRQAAGLAGERVRAPPLAAARAGARPGDALAGRAA